MLQSSDFAGRLGGALQQWLDGIRRPAHLDRPQLVDLDLGSSMPIINSLKLSACPGTGAVATPQLQLDICYEGRAAITLMVEQGASSRKTQQAHESAAASRSPGKKLLGMLHLRKASARALLYLPASMRRIPVQPVVEVTQLEGSMLMWLPPPPSDRLWISFMAPPKVALSVRPLVAGRVLKHPALASHTADSSADERAGSGISGGERGFASALLPGKFWKKRKSKSRRQLLQELGGPSRAHSADEAGMRGVFSSHAAAHGQLRRSPLAATAPARVASAQQQQQLSLQQAARLLPGAAAGSSGWVGAQGDRQERAAPEDWQQSGDGMSGGSTAAAGSPLLAAQQLGARAVSLPDVLMLDGACGDSDSTLGGTVSGFGADSEASGSPTAAQRLAAAAGLRTTAAAAAAAARGVGSKLPGERTLGAGLAAAAALLTRNKSKSSRKRHQQAEQLRQQQQAAASDAEAEDWMHFAAHMQAEAAEAQEVSFSSSLASLQHSSQTTPREARGTVAGEDSSASVQQQQQLLQRVESRGVSGMWRRHPSMDAREEQQAEEGESGGNAFSRAFDSLRDRVGGMIDKGTGGGGRSSISGSEKQAAAATGEALHSGGRHRRGLSWGEKIGSWARSFGSPEPPGSSGDDEAAAEGPAGSCSDVQGAGVHKRSLSAQLFDYHG
ncbi:hypothetical protein OEZ86_003725 [Tetradesmus obliquus]|nr:hypothetical protein OEZ86_003725 [Tetradesmus obliquus]